MIVAAEIGPGRNRATVRKRRLGRWAHWASFRSPVSHSRSASSRIRACRSRGLSGTCRACRIARTRSRRAVRSTSRRPRAADGPAGPGAVRRSRQPGRRSRRPGACQLGASRRPQRRHHAGDHLVALLAAKPGNVAPQAGRPRHRGGREDGGERLSQGRSPLADAYVEWCKGFRVHDQGGCHLRFCGRCLRESLALRWGPGLFLLAATERRERGRVPATPAPRRRT